MGNRRGLQWTFACSIKWKRFLRPRLIDREEDGFASLWRSAFAEFLGTLLLTFLGPGCSIASLLQFHQAEQWRQSGSASAALIASAASANVSRLILQALGSGFTIAVLVFVFAEVSGAHINMVISWATLMTGRLSVLRFILYVCCQLLGAIAGAGILKELLLLPDSSPPLKLCSSLPPTLSVARAFAVELTCTFFFIFVVFATAISPFSQKLSPLAGGGRDYGPGKVTPLVVGLCIACLRLVGSPLTGPSMNPSVSFGLSVVGKCWNDHWIYWAGPIAGASAAATIASALFLGNPYVTKTVLLLSRGRAQFERLALLQPQENGYDVYILPDSRDTLADIRNASALQ